VVDKGSSIADQSSLQSVNDWTAFLVKSITPANRVNEFIPFGVIFDHIFHCDIWSVIGYVFTENLALKDVDGLKRIMNELTSAK